MITFSHIEGAFVFFLELSVLITKTFSQYKLGEENIYTFYFLFPHLLLRILT